MNSNLNLNNNNIKQAFNQLSLVSKADIIVPELTVVTTSLLRFEEKRERYIWVHPEEIFFVISSDHYIKALIQSGNQKKWMTRHCTIKELLTTLPAENFIRLNKFYLLNRNHYSGIDEREKMLYLLNDFSVPVPHRISRFIIEMIKK
ncbi:MAG TPA: LytTR family transcriptional regulator DNA-binding domain-containing protein [Panacibacter sp.]|nr:LytTR family transcriptional regulator DNA-binding domain-containing protein [Panacibacter sp.]